MTPSKQQLSIWPSDYELSQAVDTNYVAGLVWGRVPQVRITWRPTPMFSWAVSVGNPEQQIGAGLVALPACCGGDIAEQYNTGTQGLAVPNLMPDIVSRAAYNPTPWLHLDAGGVLRAFRHTVAPYDADVEALGGGVSINVHANPTPTTRLIGQLASGPGPGRYVGGLAPDVAFRPVVPGRSDGKPRVGAAQPADVVDAPRIVGGRLGTTFRRRVARLRAAPLQPSVGFD